MTRPDFNPSVIANLEEQWDADIDDNFTDLENIIEAPFPVAEYDSVTSLPTASSYDRCIAVKETVSGVYDLYLSDGTNWIAIGRAPAYGMMLRPATTTQSITSTPAILAIWDTNGASKNCTPDQANNYVTIDVDGDYRFRFEAVVAAATSTDDVFYVFRKNGSVITNADSIQRHPNSNRQAVMEWIETGLVAGDDISVYVNVAVTTQTFNFEDAKLIVERIA